MASPSEEELRRTIAAAFPAERVWGDATQCSCEECREISQQLRGKTWDELPDGFLDQTSSPTLLTPRASAAFLPAWLLRALDQLPAKEVVTEFTVYSLCPYNIDDDNEDQMIANPHAMSGLAQTRELMTPEQVGVVRALLEYVRDHGPDSEWLRRFIEPALEKIWKR